MRMLSILTFAVSVLLSSIAFAGEQSRTLSVKNMTCAARPSIIEKTLSSVSGVVNVQVLFEDKTAVVNYDDSQIGVAALTDAVSNSGYPSTLVE